MTEAAVQSEKFADYKSDQTLAAQTHMAEVAIAPTEIEVEELREAPEIPIFVAKMKRKRKSSGMGESLYPPASRQDIRTKEGEIAQRRKDISEKLATTKTVKVLAEQDTDETVVYSLNQKQQVLHAQIRGLAGDQKLTRDTLRPAKPSFRNRMKEKAKREQWKTEKRRNSTTPSGVNTRPSTDNGQTIANLQEALNQVKEDGKTGAISRAHLKTKRDDLHKKLYFALKKRIKN